MITNIAKTCKDCKTEKTLSSFNNSKRGKYGKSSICKICDNNRTRAFYTKNKEAVLQHQKTYRNNNMKKILLKSARHRAKKYSLQIDIDIEDIHIPENCPLLGIPLYKAGDRIGPNSPSIDRIDSNLGYIKGNIWVISYRANTIKNDSTLHEFQTIYKNWSSKIAEQNINSNR